MSEKKLKTGRKIFAEATLRPETNADSESCQVDGLVKKHFAEFVWTTRDFIRAEHITAKWNEFFKHTDLYKKWDEIENSLLQDEFNAL